MLRWRYTTESRPLLKAKVCMVGDAGVGKTSLVRRYVLDQFSDIYVSTLGTKVMKKEMFFTLPDKSRVGLMMMVWDIIGERELLTVVKESYFSGAKGIVAVCDLSREDTLPVLTTWIQAATKVIGSVPKVLAANKLDLIPARSIKHLSDSLEKFAREHNASEVLTSAKTGENVDLAFKKLGIEIISEILKKSEVELKTQQV